MNEGDGEGDGKGDHDGDGELDASAAPTKLQDDTQTVTSTATAAPRALKCANFLFSVSKLDLHILTGLNFFCASNDGAIDILCD